MKFKLYALRIKNNVPNVPDYEWYEPGRLGADMHDANNFPPKECLYEDPYLLKEIAESFGKRATIVTFECEEK